MATTYKYLLFFLEFPVENVRRNTTTTPEPIEFFTPLQQGERVRILPHIKQMRAMPPWVRHAVEWEVRKITHQAKGARDAVDFAELVPAPWPHLPERIFPDQNLRAKEGIPV